MGFESKRNQEKKKKKREGVNKIKRGKERKDERRGYKR